MIKLGSTARHVRDTLGLKQREVAEALGVSTVHICNIEKDKAFPSPELLERYRELWGVDLYMLAWCLNGDLTKLPAAVRESAGKLADAWRSELSRFLHSRSKDGPSCSTFNT